MRIFAETIKLTNAGDYSAIQIEAWIAHGSDPDLWQQKINEHYFIKAVSGNKIAGFASLGPDGYVDLLFTNREHQRKGIATKLMVQIENKSRELGITTITAEISITALPFFSKNGFVIREKQQKRIKNTVLENYRMEKILR